MIKRYLFNLATDKYHGLTACFVKGLLFILSFIYGITVRILGFVYRINPYRSACAVISIGNITLGGTGKTSLVEFTAKYLRQEGHRVAVITRGYGRKTQDSIHDAQCENMGDEPYMLAKKLSGIPVVVDKNRTKAAKKAVKDYAADTLILDDGFQQWKIRKNLEIVVIDAVNPFGNRNLIPRGILREPLSSLKRADLFVLSKTDLSSDINSIKDYLVSIKPSTLIVESVHKPLGFYKINADDRLLGLNAFQGETVTLFSGIGDPASFESLILGLGIKIGLSFRFSDHHNYTPQDMEKIIRQSQEKNINTLITTEKDAVRLNTQYTILNTMNILVLCIELQITNNGQEFRNRLLRLYPH